MVFEFCQVSKKLYSADFMINTDDNISIGCAHFEGRMTSVYGDWTINVMDIPIQLIRIRAQEASRSIGGKIQCKPRGAMKIIISGENCGLVFQGVHKLGLLRNYNIHHIMYKHNCLYNMYPIAMGDEGAKNPIYLEKDTGIIQVAQVEKDSIVYNDMHNFHCYIKNDEHMIPTAIFCALMYSMGCYQPGTENVRGIKKVYGTTSTRELISKYDPEFWIH